MATYSIDPVEKRNLYIKLQNPLYKGFIRTSVSPWGSNTIVRKNDGSMHLCIFNR